MLDAVPFIFPVLKREVATNGVVYLKAPARAQTNSGLREVSQMQYSSAKNASQYRKGPEMVRHSKVKTHSQGMPETLPDARGQPRPRRAKEALRNLVRAYQSLVIATRSG